MNFSEKKEFHFIFSDKSNNHDDVIFAKEKILQSKDVQFFPKNTSVHDLMVHIGFFKSKGESRKNFKPKKIQFGSDPEIDDRGFLNLGFKNFV